MNKCSGPDDIDYITLKCRADQLRGVLQHIFQASTDQYFVPSLSQISTIISAPKKSALKN